MNDLRRRLLAMIDADRERLIGLLSRLVQARSPNPPGDTREAAGVLRGWLDRTGAPYRVVGPDAAMPNLLGSFDGARPGPHLVLNGHIDTFPAVATDRWTRGPFSGDVADGKIWGTGCSDMKQGTASLVAIYAWLHALREQANGRLTLTAVSDEETFGPNGARYLVEHHAGEVLGDCLLNAEPGAPSTVRFAEKSPLWIAIDVETIGCHGAYPHKSPSATRIAAALIEDLAEIEQTEVPLPPAVKSAIVAGAERDRPHPPARCRREHGSRDTQHRHLERRYARQHAAGALHHRGRYPFALGRDVRRHARQRGGDRCAPSAGALCASCRGRSRRGRIPTIRWCSSSAAMRGRSPACMCIRSRASPARMRGCGASAAFPAFTYGTTATNVAMPDEHTDIEEWMGVVKTQALSALDYLMGEGTT